MVSEPLLVFYLVVFSNGVWGFFVVVFFASRFVLFSPDERRFCVFSLAASTDGTEVLGG